MSQQQQQLLPLRLVAEPLAKEFLSSPSCVALSTGELTILVDDRGIIGLASEGLTDANELLNLVPKGIVGELKEQDIYVLVRRRTEEDHSNKATTTTTTTLEWFVLGVGEGGEGTRATTMIPYSSKQKKPTTGTITILHNNNTAAAVAEWITTAIRNYYAQQILEPSVRGFLSILEKQFAQSNLYLFELLQNAVDDGATMVKFQIVKKQEQQDSSSSMLQFTHNGRPLTPLDVLGLSSVGLSTKQQSSSGQEQQRTIGFMGIGFKAVYKRYAQVTIDDGHYAFSYKEPPSDNNKGYGWVMLPQWQTPSSTQKGMIQFQLQRPRGGSAAIVQDLAVLPPTAPPLLGRAALLRQRQGEHNNNEDCWTLDWNGQVYKIQRTQLKKYNANNSNDMSEVVTVQITNNNRGVVLEQRQQWLFLTHEYTPTVKARESYEKHTKRGHAGKEQVCGFMPLLSSLNNNNDNSTLVSNFEGVVHSVLPTKITSPLSMNLQGSFLLSVDRQQVQDLSENEWNCNILQQLPHVLATVFRWAAAAAAAAAHEDYTGIVKLLSQLPIDTTTGTARNNNTTCATSTILNQTISLQPLLQALNTEPILPVMAAVTSKNGDDATSTITTYYCRGKDAMWVPPVFCDFLNPEFLRGWLGKRPLRTDTFGREGAYHPIFRQSEVMYQLKDFLEGNSWTNRNRLATELQLSKLGVTADTIANLLRLMGAIGVAYEEDPSTSADNVFAGTSKNGKPLSSQKGKPSTSVSKGAASTSTADSAPQSSLPSSCNVWPVFLDERGSLATIDQIILPAADMASVPSDLLELLRPFFLPQNTSSSAKKSGPSPHKKRRFNQQQRQPKTPTVHRLHHDLERAICTIETVMTPEESSGQMNTDKVDAGAMSFLEKVRAEHPKQVVDAATAVTRLLEAYSAPLVLSEAHASTVVKLAKYALDTNNHKLFPFVIVDSGTPAVTKLVPAAKAYLGKEFDGSGFGSDLESFAGSKLDFVSKAYSGVLDSNLLRRRFTNLMTAAGVQTGLSVTISAIIDVEKEKKILADEVLPKLPSKRLPQLRKNATKADILLPYGLDHVMNRRKYNLLDSELAPEWSRLIDSMSPDASKGLISLLLAISVEDATEITGKTVPAAAMCLAGQGISDTSSVVGGQSKPIPGNRRSARAANDTAVPIRRRLYFLPPGQAGAKALDISEARFIKQLKMLKWLPCTVATDPGSVSLFSPEEALLDPDSSRPEMPVLQLPPAIKKRLQSSILAKALTFGTRAPPPPVTELVDLAKEAGGLMAISEVDKQRVASLSARMIAIWSTIARAHLRDGGLSPADTRTLRALCQNGYCIPVRNTLDGPNGSNWIVKTNRCVRVSETHGARDNGGQELKHTTIASLVATNFMCNFNNSLHNPFFSQPNTSLTIQKLSGIPESSNFLSQNLIRACGSFLRYCCKAEPLIPNRGSSLRDSFSYSMKWCLNSPNEFPKMNRDLKVWVQSGPGVGSKARRRRWVPLQGGEVQPVLDDNRVRSALLAPDMGIQLLGVLNHTEHEKDSPNSRLLSQIDNEITRHLGIWRLSDKRFIMKTKAKGPGQKIENAEERLQLVCALLKSLVMEHYAAGDNPEDQPSIDENSFLHRTFEPPLMIRHASLSREFQGPGMDKPSVTPMYAVFGRAPKLTKARCVLVQGDPDEYSLELEELIVQYVGGRAVGAFSQSKPWRAAVRLLSHLESQTSFLKFVERDFNDFEVVHAWKQISKRKMVLEELKQAEAGNDSGQLRKALIAAEDVCDDDEDGGDSILEGARDLLQKLEGEAESTRLKERERALQELKDASASGDIIPLRIALLAAEMAYAGDSDMDDSAMVDARDRLASLEQEATKAVQVDSVNTSVAVCNADTLLADGRGRGRGRTLPAWMTSPEGPKSVLENRTEPEKTVSVEEEPRLDAAAMNDCGRGRGRGRTLPAWMTSVDAGPKPMIDGVATDVETKTLTEPVTNGVVQPSAQTAAVPNQGDGMGRGKGRTLPAWMTTGEGPKPADFDDHNLPPMPSNDTILSPPPDPGIEDAAKDILSSILNDRDSLATLTDTPLSNNNGNTAAAGRGRGVSRTIPAWMTTDNSSGPKRARSPTEEGIGESYKKARGESDSHFEYSIQVVMDPAHEAEFARWLEPAIQAEAKARSGSAKLKKEPSDQSENGI